MKRGKLTCLGCGTDINWFQHKWHSERDVQLAELALERIPSDAQEAKRNGDLECIDCGYVNNIRD